MHDLIGKRIRLITMEEDVLEPIPPGSTGTITGVHDITTWTQIIVEWDSGCSLFLSVPPDKYEVITDTVEACQGKL